MTRDLLLLMLATFASEDLTTIAAGLLVQRGELPLVAATLACAAGIWVGDLGLWLVGRIFGTHVLEWRRVAAVLPARSGERFRGWFDSHAGAAMIGSRFAPGTRLPLYIAAGACRTSFTQFAGWSFAAVGLWTPALLGASALFGSQVSMIAGAWLAAGRLVMLVLALLLLAVWRFGLRLLNRRGRQRLAVRVSRIWRWEFWPMWLFYAPVAAWTTWLAMRHGGFRTITAANPGMPDGGVVGESKFRILATLPRAWTIPAILSESAAGHRLHALRAGVEQSGWRFPLVLKPDVGQRGSGVRLARGWDDVDDYLRRTSADVIAQPYHPGPFEAGIFYYRLPHWSRGRILCITDKHFPAVTGDGRSTMEDLIWAHRRYRMQAPTLLSRLGPRRADVPRPGERVALGIAGNHAQGAMFTDGRALITPALEARIDAIAQAYRGFYIGRFDVRYANREAFMAGRDLAIVELNGATAECTNVYDPRNSLVAAYRQLFLQWRLVFVIGAANRSAGRPVSSTERLVELLRTHLSSPEVFPVAD